MELQDKALLHKAVKDGLTNMLKMLVELGTDVNVKDNYNSTPLHFAVNHGQINMVKILLELHWTAGDGNMEVVKTLANEA